MEINNHKEDDFSITGLRSSFSNFTGTACTARRLPGRNEQRGLAEQLIPAHAASLSAGAGHRAGGAGCLPPGERGRLGRGSAGLRGPPGRSLCAPPGGGAAARAGGSVGGARRRCGERDGRQLPASRRGRRRALVRLPAPRTGGSVVLPGRQSRRRSEWGGGAERGCLRGVGSRGQRASDAPHFSACAALPPPLPPYPAPSFEAFVLPGRCDRRKLPGEMCSGRACAAPGSAGHGPRREVVWKGNTLLNRTEQDNL
ncbi:uncharacterized protein [Heliangelus exortis]|uniref:uncharacterized protein n=1 Tax=Heliangelus exortis TaxID=472823 RepID=UPI003A9205EF